MDSSQPQTAGFGDIPGNIEPPLSSAPPLEQATHGLRAYFVRVTRTLHPHASIDSSQLPRTIGLTRTFG